MYPKLCQIGPFTIYAYGLMLVIAFSLSTYLAGLQAKKRGLGRETVFNLFFTVFIFGIIGARLFYVVENLSFYLDKPKEIIMLSHGGLSWFGGLILGVISGIIYLKKNKLSVYKTLDLIAPYIALAQAIGRIGCFLNGCCSGKNNIPIQLYSSALLLLIFISLRLLQEKNYLEGRIFFTYLLLYSLKRFFVEFFRVEHQPVFLGLTIFQIISVMIFCLSLPFFFKKSRN